jgi:hypothetical protein
MIAAPATSQKTMLRVDLFFLGIINPFGVDILTRFIVFVK